MPNLPYVSLTDFVRSVEQAETYAHWMQPLWGAWLMPLIRWLSSLTTRLAQYVEKQQRKHYPFFCD